ncbi:hypothetical protein [Plantactinospora sp. KBS50]|uniref:hypothetical protein n=1 Tax=Plantactinospora sp. KBS50 TaxID=2024580 RepID=UPI001E300E7D|nr:hypothetical protein [Plantactinospora sp. KBS50]
MDTVSRRPWIFVTGRLEGESLRIGDTVTISSADQSAISTTVRSIEIHSAPGQTTIAIDASLKPTVQVGAAICRSP